MRRTSRPLSMCTCGECSGSASFFAGYAHCTRNQSVWTASLPGWWWWRGRRPDVRGESGESLDPAAFVRVPDRQRPARAAAAGGGLANRGAPHERHRRPSPHHTGPPSAATTLPSGAYGPDHLPTLQRGLPLSLAWRLARLRVSAL